MAFMKLLWAVPIALAGWIALQIQPANTYVGGAVCASCHSDIATSFESVSMSQTFGRIAEVPVLEDWTDRNTFYHEPSNQHFVMSRRADRFFQRRYQLDSRGREINSFEMEIHYAIGSGKKERDYLHRTAAGELLQLPVVWYSAEKIWGMAPGYDRPDHDNFSRRVVYRCFFCHNAYPKLPEGADRYEGSLAVYPAELPHGIDCERCHGPGGRHVREATPASIVNPIKLDRNRQMDVCMQCHLETTSQSLPNSVVKLDRAVFSFRPGERLQDYAAYFDFPNARQRDDFNIVHQAYRLLQSQCFQKSEMTCVTCHDPHKSVRSQESRFNETCASCHRSVAAHGENCVACHMPQRRTDDVVHVVMTDHLIQRRPPNGVLSPKAEPQSMPYRGSLSFYFPEPDNRYLGIGLARGADVRRGIAIMESSAPRPHFELAAAYASIGDHEKAAREYDAGLKADPAYAEGWYNLGLTLLALRREREARAAFETALQRKPLADAHVGLALLATRTDDVANARQSYKRALDIDPINITALTNLAIIERAAGNSSAANEYLQQTLRIHPK